MVLDCRESLKKIRDQLFVDNVEQLKEIGVSLCHALIVNTGTTSLTNFLFLITCKSLNAFVVCVLHHLFAKVLTFII